jgi:hypothetical protein
VKTECFACNRPFDSAEHLEQHKLKLAETKADFVSAGLAYETLRKELAEFDESTKGFYRGSKEQYQKQVDEAEDTARSELANALMNLPVLSEPEFREIEERLVEAKQDLLASKCEFITAKSFEQQHDLLVNQMLRMIRELEQVELIATDWTEESLQECEKAVALLEKRSHESDVHLQELRYAVKDLENQTKSAQTQFDKAKAEQEKRTRLEKEQAQCKDLQKYLRDNRSRMMSETWEAITALTSGYTADITEGLINNLTRDESGDFYVQEGNFNIPVAELSGAREGIVGLSLRIALGRAFFGGNSFILLDEVDAAATDYNSAAIAATLSGLDTQVLMVSHRQGVSDSAANVIVLGL